MRLHRWFLTSLGVAAMAGCGCSVFKDGKVEGRVDSVGGQLGDWVLTSGKCYSGQRENYFGVVAFGPESDGTSMKIVKDPVRGVNLVVNIPSTCKKQAEKSSCRALVITEKDCDVLRATVNKTNTTVNDIRKLDANVELDCKVGGGTIKGKLSYDGCH